MQSFPLHVCKLFILILNEKFMIFVTIALIAFLTLEENFWIIFVMVFLVQENAAQWTKKNT